MNARLVLGLIAAAAWQCVQAAPVATIQAMLAKPAVLCGRFDQDKKLAGIRKPLASSGRFCVVAGKGIVWQTLKPFPDTLRLTRDEIVHLQGERVAMRLEASREPMVRTINGVLFSLLAGDLAQLETLFRVRGSADAGGWQVALEARQPALAQAVGTISLDGNAYVRHIRIDDASGDSTTITFSDIRTGEDAISDKEAALF